MQAAYLMADDIMDSSVTRRGRTCWYLTTDAGVTLGPVAFNDILMLENLVYHIIKKYMGREDYYVQLLELFLETSLQTIFGQCMDTKLSTNCDFKSYVLFH